MTAAATAQAVTRRDFARWYDEYYANTTLDAAPWRSKVIDPKIASKARAVSFKVAQYDPEPNLLPRDEHDFTKAKNNEELLKSDLKNSLADDPMFFRKYAALVDATVTGTGFALVPWTYKEQTYYTRVVDKNGKVDLENEKKKTEKIGYNDFIPVSAFRMFIEPNAQSFYSARYVIIQDFKTPGEVEEMDWKKGGKVDDLTVSTLTEDTLNLENSRNRALATELDMATPKVELWYCYDNEEKTYTVIAGTSRELYHGPLIYWHGKMPIIPFYITPRPYSAWGVGLFEVSERLGAANNDLINHFFDQLDLSLNGMIMRKAGTTIVDWQIAPGGELVYTGEKPEQMAIVQPDAQGFQMARQVINEAIEENTVPQYELGIARSETDKTQGTATGMMQLREAAGDIVRFFERCYAEAHKTLYTMWLSNNQQFLDRNRALRILGPDGFYPKVIRPEDIVTAGTLDIEINIDAMRPRSQEVDRQFKLAYIDKQLEIYAINQRAVQMGIADPIKLNFNELSRLAAESMGVMDYDKIVESQGTRAMSPSAENQLLLQGKEFSAQEDDDHELHLYVHQELMDDPGVDEELKLNTQAHMQMHEEMAAQIKEQQDQADLQQLENLERSTASGAGLPSQTDMVKSLTGQDVLQTQELGDQLTQQGATATGQQAGLSQPAQGQAGVRPGAL